MLCKLLVSWLIYVWNYRLSSSWMFIIRWRLNGNRIIAIATAGKERLATKRPGSTSIASQPRWPPQDSTHPTGMPYLFVPHSGTDLCINLYVLYVTLQGSLGGRNPPLPPATGRPAPAIPSRPGGGAPPLPGGRPGGALPPPLLPSWVYCAYHILFSCCSCLFSWLSAPCTVLYLSHIYLYIREHVISLLL